MSSSQPAEQSGRGLAANCAGSPCNVMHAHKHLSNSEPMTEQHWGTCRCELTDYEHVCEFKAFGGMQCHEVHSIWPANGAAVNKLQ